MHFLGRLLHREGAGRRGGGRFVSVFLCLDSLHTGGTHPVCVLERGREREEDKGKEDKGKRVMKEGESEGWREETG